ncbi:MAG: DegT/DnrJ/EryC1/StrS family aminotransferase [Promethearchaeota archaeon]
MPDFPPVKYDLQTRHGTIYGGEERRAILECLDRDAPTSGEKVLEFEEKFARFCGTEYAVTVSNGTAALHVAFKAVGVGPGDEVVTTPVTWIATAAAAVVLGAKVVFADVDPETLNVDPATVEAAVTPRTKVICPVHLYGQPVDMDPVLELARERGIAVVEDAAHAPGAEYKGRRAGALGDLGCFSFHEQKNMSTLGEGGMITTDDPELYARARLYKSHCARVIGGSAKYSPLSPEAAREALARNQYWFQDYDDAGYNYRMDDTKAAVGACQLDRLEGMNRRRREVAGMFRDGLADIPGIEPLVERADRLHAYHLFPALVDPQLPAGTRERVTLALRLHHGVKVGQHYRPLVQTTAFRKRGHSEAECPRACEAWPRLLTLPVHPRMEDEHVEYLLSALRDVFGGKL